jgi:hypothetical protein
MISYTGQCGLCTDGAKDPLRAGADILVVDHTITVSKEVSHAADKFKGS